LLRRDCEALIIRFVQLEDPATFNADLQAILKPIEQR
jgi:hypothetical protein